MDVNSELISSTLNAAVERCIENNYIDENSSSLDAAWSRNVLGLRKLMGSSFEAS